MLIDPRLGREMTGSMDAFTDLSHLTISQIALIHSASVTGAHGGTTPRLQCMDASCFGSVNLALSDRSAKVVLSFLEKFSAFVTRTKSAFADRSTKVVLCFPGSSACIPHNLSVRVSRWAIRARWYVAFLKGSTPVVADVPGRGSNACMLTVLALRVSR